MRGTDASGFAWVAGDQDGVYKAPVSGARLSLKSMPDRVDAVILHTRAATQGEPKRNENNHPVSTPSDRIRLVHNGVVFNDRTLKKMLPDGEQLAEVDSSVLPAVLETWGMRGMIGVDGWAACAWFDRETGSTIHLARFESSPVAYAWLPDGSFVFASTPDILGSALIKADLNWLGSYPEPFESFRELDYWKIQDGEIIEESMAEWGDGYSYTRSSLKSVTDGGKSVWNTVEQYDADGYYIGDRREMPLALEIGKSSGPKRESKFYTIDHEGDYVDYDTFEAMVTDIRWHAGLTVPDEFRLTEDGDAKWINHYVDLGEIEDDGTFVSWINNPHLAAAYATEEDDLTWVPAGASILKHLVNA